MGTTDDQGSAPCPWRKGAVVLGGVGNGFWYELISHPDLGVVNVGVGVSHMLSWV